MKFLERHADGISKIIAAIIDCVAVLIVGLVAMIYIPSWLCYKGICFLRRLG